MRTLLFSIVLLLSSHLSAHEYFFAFGEVEYNDISQKIEATITASTHDIEKALRIQHSDKVNIFNDLTKIKEGSEEEKDLENFLLKHFKIAAEGPCHLKMIGFEVQLNGLTYFYFESSPIEIIDEITFTFDLLMDEFKSQQNKITFRYRGKSYTRPFLIDEKQQTINLI